MGNPGLANLFYCLSISISLTASCCWDHLTVELNILGRSPNKAFKAQLHFPELKRKAGCPVAASLSNSFSLCLGRVKGRSACPSALADSQQRNEMMVLLWWNHSESLQFWPLGEGSSFRRKGIVQATELVGLWGLQCMFLLFLHSHFMDLGVEGCSVRWPSWTVLSFGKSWGEIHGPILGGSP